MERWQTTSIWGFEKQGHMDLCQFKSHLAYKDQIINKFNPSSKESHAFNSSSRRNIKWEKREAQLLSLQSPTLDRGKTSLMAQLLCFSDFQVQPQYLSLCFYSLCYKMSPTCTCNSAHITSHLTSIHTFKEIIKYFCLIFVVSTLYSYIFLHLRQFHYTF